MALTNWFDILADEVNLEDIMAETSSDEDQEKAE